MQQRKNANYESSEGLSDTGQARIKTLSTPWILTCSDKKGNSYEIGDEVPPKPNRRTLKRQCLREKNTSKIYLINTVLGSKVLDRSSNWIKICIYCMISFSGRMLLKSTQPRNILSVPISFEWVFELFVVISANNFIIFQDLLVYISLGKAT